jgi:thiol-disulfide isomerase/thioredoxin
MKSYFVLILLSIGFMATAQNELTGPTTRQQLETFDWFNDEYNAYKPSGKSVKALKELDKTADYRIVVVLGTWCSDSRREVPRFYKIVDALGFPQANILTILVDENKNDASGLAKQFTIKYVPTFVFIDPNGKELGRIVETPAKNLEADWLKIISSK